MITRSSMCMDSVPSLCLAHLFYLGNDGATNGEKQNKLHLLSQRQENGSDMRHLLVCPQQTWHTSNLPQSIKSSDKFKRQETPTYSLKLTVALVEFIQLALEVKPLNLGQGFPDFAAPDTVRKALAEACTDEKNVLLNQYTRGFGHPRLIAALSKLYSKLIGRELNPLSEVLVTAGAYEALFVTIMGLVNQGDEVIIIEPFFDCYVPQVKLAGGTPVFVPLRPRKPSGTMSSADWILDPAELEAAFSEKTKAIVVNTPNNPLGKVKHKRQFSPQSSNNKNHGEIQIYLSGNCNARAVGMLLTPATVAPGVAYNFNTFHCNESQYS
nr:kynurenine--oxoglutarate transaminase 3-like [Penaeus vannamei]